MAHGLLAAVILSSILQSPSMVPSQGILPNDRTWCQTPCTHYNARYLIWTWKHMKWMSTRVYFMQKKTYCLFSMLRNTETKLNPLSIHQCVDDGRWSLMLRVQGANREFANTYYIIVVSIYIAAWCHVHFGELPTQCLHVQQPGALGLQQSLWWPAEKVLTRIYKIHVLTAGDQIVLPPSRSKKKGFSVFHGAGRAPTLPTELGRCLLWCVMQASSDCCDTERHPYEPATPRKLRNASLTNGPPRPVWVRSELKWRNQMRYRQVEGQEASFWKLPLAKEWSRACQTSDSMWKHHAIL